MAEPEKYSGASDGPATDRHNEPVIDPTSNVRELVAAMERRQDDLRVAEGRLADLRAGHEKELRVAEANRIDAIRAVDVQAVQRAAEVQAAQAQTLALQVATSAETLRTQVAAAASAATIALAAALEPVQKDIADLRRAQYEAQGQKAQVVEGQASNAAVWAVVGGVVALVLLAIALYALTRPTVVAPAAFMFNL